MFKILNIIELDKNIILGENTKSIFKKNNATKSNPPLKRFGLLPVTNSLPVKELLNIILAEERKPITHYDFKKLSKSHNIGFIVMNRVVYTPIEFNVRSLIIKSVAKDYIQPDEFGINDKTIDRFKTIRDYPKNDNWDFSTQIYGKESDKFYIIETLDGKNYRCLAPWIQSKTYGLPRFRVENILQYFSNNTTTRSSEYHTILSKQSTNNMFLKRAVDIESFTESGALVDSNIIKQYIVKKLYKLIQEIVTKKYKNDIKNSVELSVLIHDENLTSLFSETILLQYNKGAVSEEIKEFNAGIFPFSEVLSSFLVELQYMTRRFSKEMHDGYSRNPPSNKIYDLPKREKMEIIMKKIHDIIEETVELIIKDGSNIYSSLHTKYLILNNT
jgi:hypothetical protein